jgi:hypothetical protein
MKGRLKRKIMKRRKAALEYLFASSFFWTFYQRQPMSSLDVPLKHFREVEAILGEDPRFLLKTHLKRPWARKAKSLVVFNIAACRRLIEENSRLRLFCPSLESLVGFAGPVLRREIPSSQADLIQGSLFGIPQTDIACYVCERVLARAFNWKVYWCDARIGFSSIAIPMRPAFTFIHFRACSERARLRDLAAELKPLTEKHNERVLAVGIENVFFEN